MLTGVPDVGVVPRVLRRNLQGCVMRCWLLVPDIVSRERDGQPFVVSCVPPSSPSPPSASALASDRLDRINPLSDVSQSSTSTAAPRR